MRNAGGVWGLLGALSALGLAGCSDPELDLPRGPSSSVSVDFGPEASADGVSGSVSGGVPLVFRARVRAAPSEAVPWLFRGELSDYYARSVRRTELPSALSERAVPLRYWHEGSDCWLQPTEWLEPGVSYTLAFTGLGVLTVVQAREAEPRAKQVFPPPGRQKYRVSVLCELLGSGAEVPTLEPGGVSVSTAPGMLGLPGDGCVTLRVDESLTQAVVSPPLFAGSLLEPTPWLPPPELHVAQPEIACAVGQPFHGACLEVLDDRLRISAGAQDLLFALGSPESAMLVVRAGARGVLARGLAPASQVLLSGSVLSALGELETFRESVTLRPAARHLVLNEVLANALGPEPDAEWLELVNDSEQPVSLAGLWLEDSGGHVALPDVELSAGETVLLVGEGFRASGLDVPIPEGVRLLRLPSLGTRGFSNGGEALLLVGREGVLSRFPLLAAPHAGRSVARRSLDSADDDPAGFGEHAGQGASPGAPNFLDDE
ncbi:MAG TPA: lamin tail domain-containing protein [Polyangiaceae bacterium]|nr:lamin tail domain-containing protein [Polyangiaceae bacterium]